MTQRVKIKRIKRVDTINAYVWYIDFPYPYDYLNAIEDTLSDAHNYAMFYIRRNNLTMNSTVGMFARDISQL